MKAHEDSLHEGNADRSVLLVVSFLHNQMWLFRDFDHSVVDILSVSVLLSIYDDCYDG